MSESSASITQWGRETFGPVTDLKALVLRAAEEFEELSVAIDHSPGNLGDEAADVAILLHRLLGELGLDLNQAIDQKMACNRQRKWAHQGDGTGQHI